MFETLLIVWRESLEAALIVGVLLTYLARSGQRSGIPYVWAGSLLAVLAALACGVASNDAASHLDADLQELVQAGILFLAVAVLTWMVLWMHRNAAGLGGDLRRKADQALATGRLVGVATIAFVAVFREGLETVLFLWGVLVQRADLTALPFVAAGLGGAALAVATAWLFFRGFQFLSLRRFFRVTGVLLLLVAAGLLVSGVNSSGSATSRRWSRRSGARRGWCATTACSARSSPPSSATARVPRSRRCWPSSPTCR